MLKVRRRNAYNLTFSHFHMLTRSVTDAALKVTALGLKATTTTTDRSRNTTAANAGTKCCNGEILSQERRGENLPVLEAPTEQLNS